MQPLVNTLVIVAAACAWACAAFIYYRRRPLVEVGDRRHNMPIYHIVIALFTALVAYIFITGEITVSNGRSEVVSTLKGTITSVEVNGKPVNNYALLLSDLKGLDTSPFRYHHSHPVDPAYSIRLSTTRGDVTLIVRRDSRTANEYWVYYQNGSAISLSDIGFLHTTALHN